MSKQVSENIAKLLKNTKEIKSLEHKYKDLSKEEIEPLQQQIDAILEKNDKQFHTETDAMSEEVCGIQKDIEKNFKNYFSTALQETIGGKYFLSKDKKNAYFFEKIMPEHEVYNNVIKIYVTGKRLYADKKCFNDKYSNCITGWYDTNDRRLEVLFDLTDFVTNFRTIQWATLTNSDKVWLIPRIYELTSEQITGCKEITKEEFEALEKSQREYIDELLHNEVVIASGETIKAGDTIRHISTREQSKAIEEHDVLYVTDKYVYIDLYFKDFYSRVKIENVCSKVYENKE